MANSGKLQKLAIIAFSDSGFKNKIGSAFVVGINPEKYTHTHATAYNKEQPSGTAGAVTKFKKISPETVSFELIFDGTGVTGGTGVTAKSSPTGTVAAQIASFKTVAYNFNGKIHSPNYLKLTWGNLLFKCRLTSLQINYTLFTPSAVPLRAKVNATFEQYIDAQTLALAENKQSPDLTHEVIVSAGDTLPVLCHQLYGDSKYYIDVAARNRLDDFRNLTPGTKLYFPQLS